MKRISFLVTQRPFPVAAAVFCIAVSILAAAPSSAGPGGGGPAAGISETDRTEAVIRDLHARLGITEKQERMWGKVAQVMRENAKTMDNVTKTRLERLKAMNAVEDLKSFSEVTDAQAAGLRKFIPVFEALYATMSDGQKKEADQAFKAPDPRKKAKRR